MVGTDVVVVVGTDVVVVVGTDVVVVVEVVVVGTDVVVVVEVVVVVGTDVVVVVEVGVPGAATDWSTNAVSSCASGRPEVLTVLVVGRPVPPWRSSNTWGRSSTRTDTWLVVPGTTATLQVTCWVMSPANSYSGRAAGTGSPVACSSLKMHVAVLVVPAAEDLMSRRSPGRSVQ